MSCCRGRFTLLYKGVTGTEVWQSLSNISMGVGSAGPVQMAEVDGCARSTSTAASWLRKHVVAAWRSSSVDLSQTS